MIKRSTILTAIGAALISATAWAGEVPPVPNGIEIPADYKDWRLIARACDVISYDRYALNFADARLLRLFRETDKPTLWGEFCVPPTYGGRRGYGQYGVRVNTEEETAAAYETLVLAAAANPDGPAPMTATPRGLKKGSSSW